MSAIGSARAGAAVLGTVIVFGIGSATQDVVVRDPHVRPPVIDAGPLIRVDDMPAPWASHDEAR